jgi:hypothetical protein
MHLDDKPCGFLKRVLVPQNNKNKTGSVRLYTGVKIGHFL